MENEIWRPVKGYEGLYEVSNYGRVRSLNFYRNKNFKKELKPTENRYGYMVVCLRNFGNTTLPTKKQYKLHRLVAYAFQEICGNYFDGAVCNHKDENKTNNIADNLEWCTQSYNCIYGTARERTGEKNSVPVLQFDLSGGFIKEWPSQSEAGRELGINSALICLCCKEKRKTAYGYIWKYKEKEVA